MRVKLYPGSTIAANLIERGVGAFKQDKPVGITVHYTAGGTAASTIDYLRRANLRYHIIVDRDGSSYQLVYLDRKVYHAGNATWKGVSCNDNHIAVALANWGLLESHSGSYQTWAKTSLPAEQVAYRPFNNIEADGYWENVTDSQLLAFDDLMKWLVYNLDIDPENICGHDETTTTKNDPGGCLPFMMEQLRSGLRDWKNRF